MLRFNMRCALWFVVVLAVLAVGLFAAASAQANYVDGTVFSDEFNGPGSAPDGTNWPTKAATNSTLTVADGVVDLNTTDYVAANNCLMISKTFAVTSAYAAEIRFQVPAAGTLNGWQATPYSLILSDGNGGQKGGFDVNLERDGTGATGGTYSLTWGYWGGVGSNSLTTIATLNKGTWYDVISNRKADGNVDIYLDGALIATKTSLSGSPTKWFIGDGYGANPPSGHIQVDYVRLGSYVVPEPCSMTLMAIAALGLLAYAWRKQN
jgi:hypothetical protein